MQRLLLLGLNHATAPLEVREKLAMDAAGCTQALHAFQQAFPGAEAVILSTCNRVELYVGRAVHGHPRVEEMLEFLAGFRGTQVSQLREHIYQKNDRQVVGHLFRVASSLDSMVLGETQILGQVRDAYEQAKTLGAAGALLHPVFQRAVATGRLVMGQTNIGDGRLSIASVAVDYARRIFETFNDKTVLAIGAGKMGMLAMKHFAALKPGHMLLCTRDQQKARTLAAEVGAEPADFARLDDHLVRADIVVTCTAATTPIVTRGQFEKLLKARRYRPIFIIDIAVPRDIDPAVGELEHVYLYNLDDLQQVVESTRGQRADSVTIAEKMVQQAEEEFIAWHRTRELGPVIQRLYDHYHGLARDEVNRTLNKLPATTGQEREHLEDLARRIVNKLLHEPVKALREGGDLHAPPMAYLHAVEKLLLGETSDEDEAIDSATTAIDPAPKAIDPSPLESESSDPPATAHPSNTVISPEAGPAKPQPISPTPRTQPAIKHVP